MAPHRSRSFQQTSLEIAARQARSRVGPVDWLYSFPWWALTMVVVGVLIGISIAADAIYSDIFGKLQAGIAMSLRVAGFAYVSAILIGLVVGMIRSSAPRPGKGVAGRLGSLLHLFLYNLASLYVAIMRGLPILIVLLIFAFVIVPAVRRWITEVTGVAFTFRGSSWESAVIALAFTYGAFLSETFRAGIQSIETGQSEAARSLGMTWFQSMRFIILPQAIRRILPPLGNDLVAMIKDSALVSILGVRDITQIAKVSSGASFRYLETYSVAAMIYLLLTFLGMLGVGLVERRNRNYPGEDS
ncbi:MAG: amino acid ABC transporter permease [Anaerolineaceae bacterium]|nr:amino acid ABC transporter permease [Anaerolineaceae bacterium]